MEFFKSIAEQLQDGQQITLVIRKSGTNLVTSILADAKGVKDAAVKNIPPLTLNGTPEDYEEHFMESFQPLKKSLKLISDLKAYETSVKEAKKKTALAEAEKKKEADRKKSFDDLLKLARKNTEEHKFKDARAILAKAAAIEGADKKAISAVEQEIAKVSGEGNMFGGIEDVSDGKDLAEQASDNKEAEAGNSDEEPEVEQENEEE